MIYGNITGGGAPIRTIKIIDENNNELIGVITDSEVIFTANDEDVVAGKVYAGDKGVSTGTLQIG